MKGSALFNFISHIIHMGAASGKKRIAYAIANIAVMVLGVLCALGIKWSLGIMSDTSFIAGLLCLILCIALAIFTFFTGICSAVCPCHYRGHRHCESGRARGKHRCFYHRSAYIGRTDRWRRHYSDNNMNFRRKI